MKYWKMAQGKGWLCFSDHWELLLHISFGWYEKSGIIKYLMVTRLPLWWRFGFSLKNSYWAVCNQRWARPDQNERPSNSTVEMDMKTTIKILDKQISPLWQAATLIKDIIYVLINFN